MENNITAKELMQILSSQIRELSSMDINDRNISKCIAKSKEVSNLAGKAIALSAYELEKIKIGNVGENLLPQSKQIDI